MNGTNGAKKLGCISANTSDMNEDASLYSMKEEDTEQAADLVRFSPQFYSNLTSSAAVLYERQLGDGAAFLSELAFTLKNKGTLAFGDNTLAQTGRKFDQAGGISLSIPFLIAFPTDLSVLIDWIAEIRNTGFLSDFPLPDLG